MVLTGRAALTLLLLIAFGCSRKSGQAPAPLSPDKSLQSFHLSEDFHVELFAAEPSAVDRVEREVDERGGICVAGRVAFPAVRPPGSPPRSQFVLLEDREGEGGVDHSSVFADRPRGVPGVMPWKGGVIATA